MTRQPLRTIFVLLLSVLVTLGVAARPAVARAEPIQVTADVDARSGYVGQVITLQIAVNGSDSPDPPDTSTIIDFDVESLGGQSRNQTSITVINGQMTQQATHGYIFNFGLTPRRQGVLTVPSLSVTVDNTTYKTDPITIRIEPPQLDDDVRLFLEADNLSPYVGEPIKLKITLALKRKIDSTRIALSGVENDFSIPEVEMPEGFSQQFPLGVFGRALATKQGRQTLNNSNYFTFTSEQPLVPLHAGEITIGPAVLACNVITREDFFQNQGHAVSVPSNPLKITVRELPKEGRPANFNGLIGQFNLVTTAEPISVNVGDPITLKIMINGAGPMERVPRPDLKRVLEPRGFKVPDEMAAPSYGRGQVVFVQTIRAKSPDVAEIPPIELDYFDTKSGSYARVKSSPVPIKVSQTKVVTAGDAVAAPGAGPEPAKVEELAGGIAANIESPAILADQGFDLARVVRSPVVFSTVAAPPVAYAAAAIVLASRRRKLNNPAHRRFREALATARSRLAESEKGSPTDGAAAIARAICGYVADKAGRTDAGLTPADCESLMAVHDAEAAKSLRGILDRCDAARFAGIPPGEIGELRGRTLELLSNLDGKARRKS